MSAVTKPRGPLPPRVYWTRRVLALVLALLVVFGASRLLGGEPVDPKRPVAQPAAASRSSAVPGPTPDAQPTSPATEEVKRPARGTKAPSKQGKQPAKPKKTPLAAPSGPCAESDILVSPAVEGAVAGRDVVMALNLSTKSTPACTWEVSAENLVVRLTSGDDAIWTTQHCPGAVPTQNLVVRKEHLTKVNVRWSGQRSDEDCSRTTAWAEPGWYHVSSAALGGDPADKQFELTAPPRPTITPSPTPQPKRKRR